MDFIFNGAAHGEVGAVLEEYDYNPFALRPYRGDDGRGSYITVNTGRTDNEGKPVYESKLISNAPATLTKDAWRMMDEAIVKAVKPRLRLWSDLTGAGLTFNIPDAMGVTRLDSQVMGDVSAAAVSMDGLAETDRDRPIFDLVGLPLPIIHKDFGFSMRENRTSQRSGAPLDTSMGELAGEKVAEEVEKFVAGSQTFSYAGGSIYGYMNHPARITTATLDNPAGGGWTPDDTRNDVIAMIAAAQAAEHYGPYMLYYSKGWLTYILRRYSTYESKSLLQILGELPDIDNVAQADYLTGMRMILVPKRSSTVRAVQGLSITTLQWPSRGGFATNFKVFAIMVPQLRADSNGVCGIVDAVVS